MIFPIQKSQNAYNYSLYISLINPYPMLDAGHTILTETQSSEQDRQNSCYMPGAQGLWESSRESLSSAPGLLTVGVGVVNRLSPGKMLTSAHTPFSASLSPPSPRPWSHYLCPLPHVISWYRFFFPLMCVYICSYLLILIS